MDNTPSQRTWKRFKRNKPAVGGIIVILILMIMGVLGYLIMPDQTPMANNMLLQISTKKPGSTFTILRLRNNHSVETKNFVELMLFGQPSSFKEIPVSSYRFSKDSIILREYIGDEEVAEEKGFAYAELLPAAKYSELKSTSQGLKSYVLKNLIVKKTYWLGTDIYGRDLLSRLILGIRISLSVGVMAVFISLFIGITLGALAGFYGGRTDVFISWLMNVVWSLPALLLVIAISFALGKGFWQIFIAVGLSMWVEVARLVRGQIMALKQVEFVEAARALGFGDSRIIMRHILPNIAGPILVVASSNFASAILLEAGLSFLGFGAQPPMPTWGGMIKEHYGYIIIDAAYLAILPGIAIMFMVYAFNLLALGLQDAFDVKSQNTNV
ncbi:ABC transporter permease [Daejeonella oryzae]|uniref:ABC transporter permease n=1 Tax=Daejeonella oryzae TaxID=1122943 RepID=UPI00040D55BE|nr:ABC transporter permease [Daejeonella oryzae]